MSKRVPGIYRFALAASAGALTWSASLSAGELPSACFAGSCGALAPNGWLSQGKASLVSVGSNMEITQITSAATFNWSSFNIGTDSSVTFKQPDVSSVALNRIFQADASRILGSLKANGQVYLLNQNGILFGASAKVNVGGLVASSLNISQAAIDDGIARASQSSQPAFAGFRAVDGSELTSGAVRVERGATIDAAGGQVLLFAPEVSNEGTIRTPDGQTILQRAVVYLATSTDPNLRGLFVEVGVGGTATNGSDEQRDRTEDSPGRFRGTRNTIAGLAVNRWVVCRPLRCVRTARFDAGPRWRDGAAEPVNGNRLAACHEWRHPHARDQQRDAGCARRRQHRHHRRHERSAALARDDGCAPRQHSRREPRRGEGRLDRDHGP
jgi:filamentous hemagglutinin family protein